MLLIFGGIRSTTLSPNLTALCGLKEATSVYIQLHLFSTHYSSSSVIGWGWREEQSTVRNFLRSAMVMGWLKLLRGVKGVQDHLFTLELTFNCHRHVFLPIELLLFYFTDIPPTNQ